MKTLLGIIIGCITIFLFVAIQPVSADHLCGQDCNQFTDQGACTHGCTVPGSNPNPDYRNENDYQNEETQQAQQNAAASNEATAAIVIQQAVAAGVEANIAVQVLQTQYGVTNAQDALEAVKQLNAAADAAIASGTVLKGCQGFGCCLVGNCGSGQYCAGADAGRNQYGQCVDGKNEPRSGTTIAADFIKAGGDRDAVIANPQAFFGEKDYDAMQGKNGQDVKKLEDIVNAIKGVANTGAGTTAVDTTTTQILPDNLNCNLHPEVCNGCAILCGDSTTVAFCGDALAKVTATNPKALTCNEQILLYGGSTIYAQSTTDCEISSGNRDPVPCAIPADFGWDWNTKCFTNNGANLYASNLCANGQPSSKNGECNNKNETTTSGPNCIDPKACGLQQVDVCGMVGGTYKCAFVSMLTSGPNCIPEVPSTLPTITRIPFPPLTTSSNPPSSPTPPQSPPPPGSPVCVGETSSISAPQLGQSPVFTCTPASQATRYEFQWKLGSGAYQSLAPSATGSNVSTPLLVNSSGTYTIQ